MKKIILFFVAMAVMSLLVFTGCEKILGIIGLEKKKGDTPPVEEVQPPQPGATGKGVAPATPSPAPSVSPDMARASVNGKYYNLLRTIYVPSDQNSYGNFYDWGHYTGSSWKGHTNLPPGYWVYVYPNWYIWRDRR